MFFVIQVYGTPMLLLCNTKYLLMCVTKTAFAWGLLTATHYRCSQFFWQTPSVKLKVLIGGSNQGYKRLLVTGVKGPLNVGGAVVNPSLSPHRHSYQGQ